MDIDERSAGREIFTTPTWDSLAESLSLSGRELEIIQAVFDDENERQIAARLGISRHTVHTHLERLYRKLSISSRVQLVIRVFNEYWMLADEVSPTQPTASQPTAGRPT